MSKVMIIEDDIYLSDDLKFFVEDAGHTCVVYDSADDFIDNLNLIDDFDIFILDIMMMKGNKLSSTSDNIETGEEIYKIIRNKHPNKKIIVLTAKDFAKICTDFRIDRNVITLNKPVTEGLINTILNAIE